MTFDVSIKDGKFVHPPGMDEHRHACQWRNQPQVYSLNQYLCKDHGGEW